LLLVTACGQGDAKDESPGELAVKKAAELSVDLVEPKSTPKVEPEAPALAPALEPLLDYTEALGGLKLGMTAAQLQAIDPELKAVDPIRQVTQNSSVLGPGTYYSQTYRGGKLCDWAELHGPAAEGVLRLAEMSTGLDSPAKTVQGIAAGSSRRALKKAYPSAFEPIPGEFWVRISDHEMLTILLEQGKVSSLYLGPSREVEDIEE